MKASVRLLVTSALALAVASGVGFAEAASPAKASVSFSRGAWDRGKWSVLKSPRWNYLHGFEQLDDCIANETPGTKTIDWYSSMAYNGKFGVGDTVTVRMGFDDKFAPGIVIASELPDIPATFYAGINANEGRCRFHAFEVK